MSQQAGLKSEQSPDQVLVASGPDFKSAGTDALQHCGEYMVSCGFAGSGFASRMQYLADHVAPQAQAWLLPVAYGTETVEIGPLLGGKDGNCYRCWYDRRIAADPQGKYLRHMLDSGEPVALPRTVRAFLHEAIVRFTAEAGGTMHPLRNAAWVYRLLDDTAALHRAVPLSECHCTADAEGTADTRPVWQCVPKPAAHEYRIRSLAEIGERAIARFLDDTAGPVQSLNVNLSFPGCAVAVAEFEVEVHGRRELGCGAASDYRTARYVGMLEALERYAGHLPHGRPQALMCSPDEAELMPLNHFGIHEPDIYESGVLDRLTPGVPIACVRGHSLTRDTGVLLDEQLVYYSAWKVRGQPRHVVEISNGCALGTAPEECVFHGLLEIIERDAFLAAWYRQRVPDRIAIGEIDEPEFRHRKAWCEALGYVLTALDLRTETGVPVVLLTLRGDTPGLPAFLCSVSAHPVPEQAVSGAMSELMISLTKQRDLMRAEPDRVAKLVGNPLDVRQMDDHALRYCSPDAARDCDFLLEGGRTLALDSLRGTQQILAGHDLYEDLQALVAALGNAGLEVLVADQTPLSFVPAGLHVFKTLVPGMLPMTFGRHLRRVGGIDRLDTLPERLGGTWLRPAPGAINPLPHPFP